MATKPITDSDTHMINLGAELAPESVQEELMPDHLNTSRYIRVKFLYDIKWC